ncbi:OV-16 antigen-like isoform X2 [Bemisia tabaci]|uniref:OV-16 antigen-like isoform X2 n=1 Tax=Bemisia tabaci TaxID=7038 RepID=UPI003B27BB66
MVCFDSADKLSPRLCIIALKVSIIFAFNPQYPRTTKDIEEVFLRHKVVPDVVSLAPDHLMRIDYRRRPTVDVDYGNDIHYFQMKKKPLFLYWPYENNDYYTMIMTARKRYVFLVFRHPDGKRIPFDEQYTGEKYDVFRDSDIIDQRLRRAHFSTRKFMAKYNFSRPWAGNFFYGRVNTTYGYIKPTDYDVQHNYDFWRDETWDPDLN